MSEHIPCPDAHLTIWTAFADIAYRHSYAEAHGGDFLASQIYSLRTARGWNQSELAERAGVTQPMVCLWEKSCEGVRLPSIYKLAAAFDVAVLVKFVPFSQFAKEAIGARADQDIPSYDDESPVAIGFGEVRILPTEARTRQSRTEGSSPSSYLRWAPELQSGRNAVSISQ